MALFNQFVNGQCAEPLNVIQQGVFDRRGYRIDITVGATEWLRDNMVDQVELFQPTGGDPHCLGGIGGFFCALP